MKKKLRHGLLLMIMSVMLIGMMSTSVWAAEDTVISNDEMGIPDERLYAAILEKADSNEDGELTVAEAENADSLSLSAESADEVLNLAGIGYCKNLTSLSLQLYEIQNVEVLQELTGLKSFSASMNYRLGKNVDELLNVLKKLTNLERLELDNNNVSDISTLGEFTNLKYLNLDNNNISNINMLSYTGWTEYQGGTYYIENGKLI